MLVIALDTSTPAVTAGVVVLDDQGPRALAERVTVNPRAHGELLTPHLLDVLSEVGHQLGDVDAIVVGAGPGPFTGLRVGMVTAAALGHAAGRRVYPVCSLDAIAAQAEPGVRTLVATDARRSEVYWAAYDGPTRLAGPNVNRPEEVPALIEEFELGVAAGEMAEKHREAFGLDVVGPVYPTADGLVSVVAEVVLAGGDPDPLVPLYLRRPDAQEPGARKPVTTNSATGRGRS